MQKNIQSRDKKTGGNKKYRRGNGNNRDRRYVAPVMYAKPENTTFVLQFRLTHPLNLPRLPEEFNCTGKTTRKYTGPSGEIIEQSSYFAPSMKSLVAHLEQENIGFRFIYFDYAEVGEFYRYRFVFSREDRRDNLFKEYEKDLRQILANLLKRKSLTTHGGVRIYRNPATDEMTGLLIEGQSWISVNITDEIVVRHNQGNRDCGKKDKIADFKKRFASQTSPQTTGSRKSSSLPPAKEDWHDKLKNIRKDVPEEVCSGE